MRRDFSWGPPLRSVKGASGACRQNISYTYRYMHDMTRYIKILTHKYRYIQIRIASTDTHMILKNTADTDRYTQDIDKYRHKTY
jgi:hypothetical protein